MPQNQDHPIIEWADVRGEEAAQLMYRLSDELAFRYGEGDGGAGNFKAEDVMVPGSGFLVARLNGQAVGCGAFRQLEVGVAEVGGEGDNRG